MPSKSIFRQPGAQHFQVVHRSQRDPLINDPDASQHVLKPVVRENAKKGKSRADLEASLSPSDLLAPGRSKIGEASLYGVYFDDTDYDYLQHLRPVGGREDGFESVLVETPTRRITSKKKNDLPISLHDLPPDVLPSATELPRDFESQAAVQSSISGLQPGMDPHLRQALEALEDDAYVDDDLDDDFFGELVKDGEREATDRFEFEFKEGGLPTDGSDDAGLHEDGGSEAGWLARFAAFKEQQGRKPTDTPHSDCKSEEADTVGKMPEFSTTGGRRRQQETSDASGFSMSSSSIFRSDGLRDLDDRFDQIEKEYIESEGSEDGPPDSDDSDSEPELITSREDFDSLMDDFLHNYEVSGGKMKPSLPGSGPEKLQSLRTAMGRGECLTGEDSDQEGKDDDIYAMIEGNEKPERWDVETVLTTYTNLENHPRLIKAREKQRVPKIRLDPKTGFPLIENNSIPKPNDTQSLPGQKAAVPRAQAPRPRDESAEEKRRRKRAVKVERQARRVEKKEKKEQFSAALKQQSQALSRKGAQVTQL